MVPLSKYNKTSYRIAAAQYAALELPRKTRELVILLLAKILPCKYEWVQHVQPSKTAGVTPEQISAIEILNITTEIFNPTELAALKFTIAALNAPTIPPEVFQSAQNQLSNRQLVELVGLIGFYWMAGRMATIFEIELDIPIATEINDIGVKIFSNS